MKQCLQRSSQKLLDPRQHHHAPGNTLLLRDRPKVDQDEKKKHNSRSQLTCALCSLDAILCETHPIPYASWKLCLRRKAKDSAYNDEDPKYSKEIAHILARRPCVHT